MTWSGNQWQAICIFPYLNFSPNCRFCSIGFTTAAKAINSKNCCSLCLVGAASQVSSVQIPRGFGWKCQGPSLPWRNTAGIGSGGRAPAVQEASRHTMQNVGPWDHAQNLPQGWDHEPEHGRWGPRDRMVEYTSATWWCGCQSCYGRFAFWRWYWLVKIVNKMWFLPGIRKAVVGSLALRQEIWR